MGLLNLNCRLPMPEFSGYHSANEYYKRSLNSTMPLTKFKLIFLLLKGIAQ